MNGKSFPSEISRAPSVASRVFLFVNRRRLTRCFWILGACLVLLLCTFVEIQTSLLQSWIFTSTNQRLFFKLEKGASRAIAFPRSAPFDDRRGYSLWPQLQHRLQQQGYRVTGQARQSETMSMMLAEGIAPPYDERPAAGLDIRGSDGTALFHYGQGEFLFKTIGAIPPLIVKALLFLENRDLEHPATPWQNPVIEWDRTLKAALMYVGAKLHLPLAVQGGSTLAVQLEKFRHSPNGRTDTPFEKLRQIIGASLKAYREGANTRAWRERIIVDYLNTVPLAAAPGYGEIHGLGEGLYAWFGMRLDDVVAALKTPGLSPAKVRVFKHALTLLISVRAPSTFLVDERSSLEHKVNQFIRLMARHGVIDWEFAAELQETPIHFLPAAPLPPQPLSSNDKAANAIRTHLLKELGLANVYDLNRLHLRIRSSFDVALQREVGEFLNHLADPKFVSAHGLRGERLLEDADPSRVIYSFLLVEAAPEGNFVRVQADNFAAPLDFNESVKLELGSTAKLRTLTHYLDVMHELYTELSPLSRGQLARRAHSARDPLTRWATAEIAGDKKKLSLQAFLDRAMGRQYSASPHEEFLTGGGVLRFENFDKRDDDRIVALNDAFSHSINLVFIRLMRDLVRYHRARLSYDADDVLANPENPKRQRMLKEITDEESRLTLRRAYQKFATQPPQEILARLLRGRKHIERRLAIVFFAWHMGVSESDLQAWLQQNQVPTVDIAKLFQAYHNPRLNLTDYAFLLGVHPLSLWCAGQLYKSPQLSWDKLYAASGEARRASSAWLLSGRNRRAQDLRLRTRIEKDAFDRMTPYWQKLGFPFKTMVPSYATAIGSSSDRPVALAELVGILVNDGVRRPLVSLAQMHFADGTPYETILERPVQPAQRVLAPEIARTMRRAMAEVVERGTARRLNGIFKLSDGKRIVVGAKTGSGDNRFETFSRSGAVTSSRATNRTATLVFYIGQRYFGVLTAYVRGAEADNYRFTSALPVALLKLLAPAIIARLENPLADRTGYR